ncbi:hypothetical protein ACFWXT_29755, partial [Bacillus cereus]|uniref:hypothetical protein n=1 Tax=Bacillus cereus TaxID=1396 RepID=UPI00366B5E99
MRPQLTYQSSQRDRTECDVTPLEHHVTLFLTFRPLGSLNWETMGLGGTDSQIPAPWVNYGGSTT